MKNKKWTMKSICSVSLSREQVEGMARMLSDMYEEDFKRDEDARREILGDAINEDDSVGPYYGHYMAWSPGDEKITLDSDFTLEELEALAWWMRNHTPPSPTVEASDLKSDQCEFESRGGDK